MNPTMQQSKKSPQNPLLAPASSFSLSDSFGPQPALLVPTTNSGWTNNPPGNNHSSPSGFLGDPLPSNPDFLALNRAQRATTPTQSLSTTSSSSSLTSLAHPGGYVTPTLTASLGPPPPGVFLLPSTSPQMISPSSSSVSLPPTAIPGPAGGAAGSNFTMGAGIGRKSRYVVPPGIVSSPGPALHTGAFATPSATGDSDNISSTYLVPPVGQTPYEKRSDTTLDATDVSQALFRNDDNSFYSETYEAGATSWLNVSSVSQSGHEKPSLIHHAVPEVAHHWFYLLIQNGQEQWKPFTMIDSVAIEERFLVNPNACEPIPTDGGRYDVDLPGRKKAPVFWIEDPLPIRRCSWFVRSNTDGRWTPYDEEIALKLEEQYVLGIETGRWNRKLEINVLSPGEYVVLHSETVMMHFPSGGTGLHGGNLDDWGQVQPQTAIQKSRVVHRGLEGLPDIPDGEVPEVDHLVFMVHGIGSACDIKLRSITEVVDSFRSLTSELSEKHFRSAHLSGKANRIEFLPVNWHTTLHGDDAGTDERLKPLTLKSIPKLRNFVNDTLLDILFYTSPIYCQTILDTVVLEINRMYTLFMVRNENFKGTISVMGHSLGSLIMFDVLTHQTTDLLDRVVQAETMPLLSRQQTYDGGDLEGIFAKLEISEFAENFTKEGIDLGALLLCTEDDLKEGGLPLGPRKKLMAYLESRKNSAIQQLSGMEEFQRSSVTEEVKYVIGPAGTGQPCVQYPRLCFQPSCFYALGSPISMFLAVRGIDSLGANFKFPTCPRFFNIFHPFDPVAYRVESLIKAEYGRLRPVIIPHHMGRKRMHLELKDTVTKLMTTDIKQKIIDSVSATLNTVYNIATGSSQEPSVQTALEDTMRKRADGDEEADESNPRVLEAALNQGQRIDYVLQEAPLESFNEYLFALASHLCYWESEDTCLMVLKDIYSQLNIFSDDDNALKNVPFLNTSTYPPKLEQNTATAFKASTSVAASGTTIPQTRTPILAPPPVPIGGTMKGPAVPQTFTTTSSYSPSPSVTATQQTPFSTQNEPPGPTGPPPTMFSPSDPTAFVPKLGPPLSVKSAGGVKPGLLSAYPKAPSNQGHPANSSFGMDPTAPLLSDRPIAPPPMSGFYKN